MRTPEPTGLASTSRKACLSLPTEKRGFPLPKTTGYTISLYSSTRLYCIKVFTSCALPATRIFPPGMAFNFVTSLTILLLSSVELVQPACSRVVETTYLGMLFMRSAKPISSENVGQAAAKPS